MYEKLTEYLLICKGAAYFYMESRASCFSTIWYLESSGFLPAAERQGDYVIMALNTFLIGRLHYSRRQTGRLSLTLFIAKEKSSLFYGEKDRFSLKPTCSKGKRLVTINSVL